MTKECCEDVEATFLQRNYADNTAENESSFLGAFNFPLQRLEDLNEVEQYLQQQDRFQSTVCLLLCFLFKFLLPTILININSM
jgi:hypothetical protein